MTGWTLAEIDAAVRRAYREDTFAGFSVFAERNGHIFAIYTNERGDWYRVTDHDCSCDAGRRGRPCKHLMGILEMCGRMDQLVPGWYALDHPSAIVVPTRLGVNVCNCRHFADDSDVVLTRMGVHRR